MSGTTTVLSCTNEYTICVRISDVNKIAKYNTSTKKLLVYLLCKINSEALINRVLTREYVDIKLSELVENGMYSTISHAKIGVLNALETIKQITVSGEFTKQSLCQKEFKQIIAKYDILPYKSICRITLEQGLNYQFLFSDFSILPNEYYKLSSNSSTLLEYIFYMANIRKSDINKDGYITISNQAIYTRLMLPDIETANKNGNASKTIRKPIEQAVQEINDMFDSNELEIISVGNDYKTVFAYLEYGKVQVYFKGTFADFFNEKYELDGRGRNEMSKSIVGLRT